MLDIESELIEAADIFVSLSELAETVYIVSGTSPSYSAIADWLLIRLKRIDNARNLPPLVTMDHFYELVPVSNWNPDIQTLADLLLKLRSHNCLPFNHPPDGESGSYWTDGDLFSMGFEREAIAKVLPENVRSYLLAEITTTDDPREFNSAGKDPLDVLTPAIETDDSFRGKDSLLEIIAGQAIYIGKISGKHIRSTGINKSALAKDVHATMCDFGKGLSIDIDQCRKIIGDALKLKASLDMNYLNLDAERQFAKDHE